MLGDYPEGARMIEHDLDETEATLASLGAAALEELRWEIRAEAVQPPGALRVGAGTEAAEAEREKERKREKRKQKKLKAKEHRKAEARAATEDGVEEAPAALASQLSRAEGAAAEPEPEPEPEQCVCSPRNCESRKQMSERNGYGGSVP